MSSNQTIPRSEHERDLQTCMAYAQASLTLVESLMLALLDRGLLTRPVLVELIEAAAESAQPSASEKSREAVREDLRKALIGRIANSVAAADCPPALAKDPAATVSSAQSQDDAVRGAYRV